MVAGVWDFWGDLSSDFPHPTDYLADFRKLTALSPPRDQLAPSLPGAAAGCPTRNPPPPRTPLDVPWVHEAGPGLETLGKSGPAAAPGCSGGPAFPWGAHLDEVPALVQAALDFVAVEELGQPTLGVVHQAAGVREERGGPQGAQVQEALLGVAGELRRERRRGQGAVTQVCRAHRPQPQSWFTEEPCSGGLLAC